MTTLARTPLSLPDKINCSAQALTSQNRHGAMSALTQEYGISRPTLYEARSTAITVLEDHFNKSEAGEILVLVDEMQLKRAIVALRAMSPNSLRAIKDLLPILYPGVSLSFGKIQSITSEAETKAAIFNRKSDLSCIKSGALDEMFSQGAPVLAGVDLDSGYLFGLSLRTSRSGADWAEVLREGQEQGLDLSVVVKDAGAGIDAGVREVFPNAERRDDCFHAIYEMNKVQRHLESKAYAAITLEHEEEKNLPKIRAIDKTKRITQKCKITAARKKCLEAIENYEQFTAAKKKVRDAMEYIDINSGKLRTGEQTQSIIETAAEVMMGINYWKSKKVARYIRNRAPGLSLAIVDLNSRLQALSPAYHQDAVCLASLILYLISNIQKHPKKQFSADNCSQHLIGAFSLLKNMLGEKTDDLLEAVEALLEKHHRASSAIEGFNAALRPHLYVHKGATQSFLELFRAYYNLRIRRAGRHKGTSPHYGITGSPVNDWLSFIGYPPSNAATIH